VFNEEFVVGSKTPKIFRIVTTRQTSGTHFKDGLIRSIKNSIPYADYTANQVFFEESMASLGTYFPQALPVGSVVDLVCSEDGSVLFQIDGRQAGQIKNATLLCRAITNNYLGHEAKVTQAKTESYAAMEIFRNLP